MRKRTIAILALVGTLGALIALAAMLSSPSKAEVAPSSYQTVFIYSYGFDPSSLILWVGDTVGWENWDSTLHTVSCIYCPEYIESGPLAPMDYYSHTFETPGEYNIYCQDHPWETMFIRVWVPVPEFPGTVGFLAALFGTFALVGYSAHRRRQGTS